MKARRFFIWLLLFAGSYSAFGQSGGSSPAVAEDIFALQLASDRDFDHLIAAELRDDVDSFIENVKKRSRKHTSTEVLIRDVFYRGHQKFLKHYSLYSSYYDLLTRGNYDCLSGTIFYAYVLDQLEIPFEIIEMPHHIYIVINTGDTHMLLESTDPINGIVSGDQAINERIAADYDVAVLHEEVSLFETIGLQYFNAAVNEMNNAAYLSAVDNVEMAVKFYNGPRMIRLGLILTRAITASTLDEDTKFACILRLNRSISDTSLNLASIN